MAPPAVAATTERLDLDAAREQAGRAAFTACDTTQVGLELEFHLVDPSDPLRRPAWSEVLQACTPAPLLPGGSRLTVEPGGQLELSAPPAPDTAAAVDLLLADERVLVRHCAEQGLGLLPWGADPVRAPQRVHPGERYAAMADHFASQDAEEAGARMMTSTASLQVNLDVGDGERGRRRWRALEALAPVLTAVSACSPQLAGDRSGWSSMRQQAWSGIDARRTGAVPHGDDAAETWAAYALAAPVMLVGDGAGAARPVRDGTTFGEWVADPGRLGREATAPDLAYHLTTLFPPLRPRGHVEVRCLDAADRRWWPGLVALTSVVHDDAALDRLAHLCRDLPELPVAARDGLTHPGLRDAAAALVELAAHSVAGAGEPVGRSLEHLARAVASGRSPGDDVRDRIDAVGVDRAVREAVDDQRGGHARQPEEGSAHA